MLGSWHHDRMLIVIGAAVAIVVFVIGLGLGWYLGTQTGGDVHGQVEDVRKQLTEGAAITETLRDQKESLTAEVATLTVRIEEEQRRTQEQKKLLEHAREQLIDAFKALSAEALQTNNEAFLRLAKEKLDAQQKAADKELETRQKAIGELLKPVRETLTKVDERIEKVEQARSEAYGRITEELKQVTQASSQLRTETASLVTALRKPDVRGRWGEVQLRNVVEMAGMIQYCDFDEQVTLQAEDGSRLRPDLVVRLPGNKRIAVDAKAPLDAYLRAIEAPDQISREIELADHARQVRDHLKKLGSKAYQDALEGSPEFVVLFLPGESFFAAALEQDPTLINEGVDNKVILATPTTLIALLKTVAFGWRQEQLAQNAREISILGAELHDRIRVAAKHFGSVGDGLTKAIEAYNKMVGSMERRVLVTARRFHDLQAAQGEPIPDLNTIDHAPRILHIEGDDPQEPASAPEDNDTE